MRTRLPHLFAALALTLFLTACSKLTPENFEKLSIGMSPAEVEDIIGKAPEVTSDSLGPIQRTKWNYRSGGKEVRVVFLNGKLLEKNFDQKK